LQFILNEAEVKIKTAMWMRQNADFLKEMKGMCMIYLVSDEGSGLQVRGQRPQ